MDFAKKLLNKYGWKEGDGLGKNNTGIAKPLKASLKFDNAGFGANQATSDFNNHWWERVFNEAADNLNVKKATDGDISMDLKEQDSVEISTKGFSVKKLKKAKEQSGVAKDQYTNFLQSATLTKAGDEVENPHKIDVSDIEVTQYKTLTDEELFQACGGRTAHKGARHGLKLNGKLSRLERQEQELLAKMQSKLSTEANKDEPFSTTVEKKQRKRKSEKLAEESNLEALLESQQMKPKKSKHTRKSSDGAQEGADAACVEKPKKKKQKHKDECRTEIDHVDSKVIKKCKKKKKQKE